MLCWLIVLVVSGHGSNKLSKLSLRHPWTQVRQFVEWKFSRRAHFTKPLRTTRDRVYTYVSCLVLSCRSFMSVISRFEFRWFGQWWWMKEKFLAKLDFYSRFRLLSRRLGNERHTLPTGEQHGRKINIMTSRKRIGITTMISINNFSVLVIVNLQQNLWPSVLSRWNSAKIRSTLMISLPVAGHLRSWPNFGPENCVTSPVDHSQSQK